MCTFGLLFEGLQQILIVHEYSFRTWINKRQHEAQLQLLTGPPGPKHQRLNLWPQVGQGHKIVTVIRILDHECLGKFQRSALDLVTNVTSVKTSWLSYRHHSIRQEDKQLHQKTLASIWSDRDQDKAESWLIGVLEHRELLLVPFSISLSPARCLQKGNRTAGQQTNKQQTNKQTASMTV